MRAAAPPANNQQSHAPTPDWHPHRSTTASLAQRLQTLNDSEQSSARIGPSREPALDRLGCRLAQNGSGGVSSGGREHITRLAAAIALLGPWLCGAASAPTAEGDHRPAGRPALPRRRLTCVSVEVPVDYRANTGPKIKIEYAVSFASGESKGILFYVVGGPGGSGIGVADDYLVSLRCAPDREHGHRVLRPARDWPRPRHRMPHGARRVRHGGDRGSIAGRAIAAAKTFAADCAAELKSRDLLGFVDTEAAIRDLRNSGRRSACPGLDLRRKLRHAILPAIRHGLPDRGQGRAARRRGRSGAGFRWLLRVLHRGCREVLARVLAACGDIAACAKDMQGDAAASYDALAAKLRSRSISRSAMAPPSSAS